MSQESNNHLVHLIRSDGPRFAIRAFQILSIAEDTDGQAIVFLTHGENARLKMTYDEAIKAVAGDGKP
jgi:hypothetical protein